MTWGLKPFIFTPWHTSVGYTCTVPSSLFATALSFWKSKKSKLRLPINPICLSRACWRAGNVTEGRNTRITPFTQTVLSGWYQPSDNSTQMDGAQEGGLISYAMRRCPEENAVLQIPTEFCSGRHKSELFWKGSRTGKQYGQAANFIISLFWPSQKKFSECSIRFSAINTYHAGGAFKLTENGFN